MVCWQAFLRNSQLSFVFKSCLVLQSLYSHLTYPTYLIKSTLNNQTQIIQEKINIDHKYKLPILLDKQISLKPFKQSILQLKSKLIIKSKKYLIPKIEIQIYYGSLSKVRFDGNYEQKINIERMLQQLMIMKKEF
ncbi:unnamed protein product [Paramecium pentaurelia]|uniref:Uncharacterized protein n=1 Tax=Paramecium pentaurelia TaxID=43138 RepID=A0A8S1S6W0_9CILI|nr:unnamed protein product [Paramecium pentaurelia]